MVILHWTFDEMVGYLHEHGFSLISEDYTARYKYLFQNDKDPSIIVPVKVKDRQMISHFKVVVICQAFGITAPPNMQKATDQYYASMEKTYRRMAEVEEE